MNVEAGQVFLVPYPFVRDIYVDHVQDDGEWEAVDVPTWRPGTRGKIPLYSDEDMPEADGMGTQILTVVSVHAPGGRYRPKVFYTRQWRDPDGKTFGKRTLRMKGITAFITIASGYRVPFEHAAEVAVAR